MYVNCTIQNQDNTQNRKRKGEEEKADFFTFRTRIKQAEFIFILNVGKKTKKKAATKISSTSYLKETLDLKT